MNHFDTQARLAFYYAQEEATALAQPLTPEHLLLGLMHVEGGAHTVLEALGARLGPLRALYQASAPPRDHHASPVIGPSQPLQSVIDDATRARQAQGVSTTSSQHVLLALLDLSNPVLQQMFRSIQPNQAWLRRGATAVVRTIDWAMS